MNFNVYIDKKTGERLERLAKTKHKSRNAVIREALADLLDNESPSGWPREVLDFKGLPKTRPFEDMRQKLGAPAEDTLA